MTEKCCETCVHYPPSSFGGKPCSCCKPSDSLTSCWDGKPEREYIEREAAIYAVLGITICNPMVRQYADAVLFNLNKLPTADVAPVRRCRDCRWSYDEPGGRTCSHGVCVDCIVPDDFGCAGWAGMEESDG